MKRLAFILSFALASLCAAAEPSRVSLQLVQDGNQRFHIEVEGDVAAPLDIVTGTLRDYEHLPQFIPMLVKSRRVMHKGQPAIDQTGRAKVLFMHFDAQAVLRETWNPQARTLELTAIDGDFTRFENLWRFDLGAANRTRFSLKTEAVLKRWVPQWLVKRQLKKSVDRSMAALLTEMERRAAKQTDPSAAAN